MDQSFDYQFAPVSELEAVKSTCPQTGKEIVTSIVINGQSYLPTQRFWTSLYARFGFNKAFFKYFDHTEVFERIAARESRDKMRICVEKDSRLGTSKLLSVSNPTKPIVDFDSLIDKVEAFGGENVRYHDGVLESWHKPRSGATINIGGDEITPKFVVASPIDGYGLPNVYLAMIRHVCENGMVAYAKMFRSTIAMGKGDDNVAFALVRTLDQFGHDEGYAALRERLESSVKSWASVYEAVSMYRLLVNLHHKGGIGTDGASMASSPKIRELLTRNLDGQRIDEDEALAGSPILRAFHNMTGDVNRLYGLANIDSLSAKRQRTLPVKCTMYDLLNFATEAATHHVADGANGVYASRQMQAWVGSSVSGEYDMEGTCEKYQDFADFHISSKLESGLTGSDHEDEAIVINSEYGAESEMEEELVGVVGDAD